MFMDGGSFLSLLNMKIANTANAKEMKEKGSFIMGNDLVPMHCAVSTPRTMESK